MTVLFTSENSKVLHVEESNIIIVRVMGIMTDEAYFEIWEKVLVLMVAKNSKRLILNQILGESTSFPARNKVLRVYVQQYKKNVNRELKIGILQSLKIKDNSDIKYLVEIFRSQTSFEIEFFKTEETAVEWLTSAN